MEIEELYKIFDRRFKADVLPYIESKLERSSLSEPVYYYLDNFHIRTFRSALPILIGEALGADTKPLLAVGAASELVFYIALVQDDIIDNDDQRGSIQSSHKKFGVPRVAASADYCYGAVFALLEDLSKTNLHEDTLRAVLAGFKAAHIRLYRSFLSELNSSFDFEMRKEDIERIHLDKTAQGINAMYCTGLVIDNSPQSALAQLLKSYSEKLAAAGQIKNDLYDFTRYAKIRGLSDFKNGYINYVIWLAMDRGIASRAELKKIFREKNEAAVAGIIGNKELIKQLKSVINGLVESAIKEVRSLEADAGLKEILTCWAEGNRKTENVTNKRSGSRLAIS